MEYNGRTHFIIQTSSIGPVLSICKVYTEHIMEFFVMRNEINITFVLDFIHEFAMADTGNIADTGVIKS